jgi:hypothetical protein
MPLALASPPVAPFGGLPVTPEHHFRVHMYLAVQALVAFCEGLEGVMDRHPFLRRYAEEAAGRLPADPARWAAEASGWEREHGGWLPLRAVSQTLGLPVRGRLPLLLAGLVEEDLRFGSLFADLQAPVRDRRPSVELAGRVLAPDPASPDPYQVVRPLLEAGFLEAVDPEAPRSERTLRVPSLLWAALRGEPPALPRGMTLHEASAFGPAARLVLPPTFLRRLARAVPLVQSGQAGVVVVHGAEGSDRLGVAGAVARALGRGVMEVPGAHPDAPRMGPLCTLLGAMPALRFDLAPGETAEVPELRGYAGPVAVLTGKEGGLKGSAVERAVTLPLPTLGLEERRRCWSAALGKAAGPDLEAVAERYHLGGAHIRRLAKAALGEASLSGRPHVALADVRAARQQFGRELLDTLAEPLAVDVAEADAWGYLVAAEAVRERLHELETRCRHRERLLGHLGAGFGTGTGRGVRALFAGPSGTGKTLAARLLAARLGMDLYRVDLAAVVNKYIGETEKNLHRVLSAAESLDVLLLLDEGDALLGSRTDVKSANDRYANLETNYLLQRLEHYDGVVVVTTNLGENIDRGFQRRLDLVVDFLPPGPEERHALWRLHLPTRHAVDEATLDAVAGRCALTGGQIRNAAQLATLLALDEGPGPVADRHLLAALRSEYRKAGATSPLEATPSAGHRTSSTHAFLGTLAR